MQPFYKNMSKKSLPIIFLASVQSTASLTASVTEADTTRMVTLEGITVISTPKETGSMRQQPSMANILSAPMLEAAHVSSVKEISNLVPNLFIPDYGSRLTSAI